jgi:hypothetical protein
MRKIGFAALVAAVARTAATATVSRAEASSSTSTVGGIDGGQQPVRSCESLLLVTFSDGPRVTSAIDRAASGSTPPPGSGVNTSSQPMTRPVCLYPQRVRYKGSGSIYDAANFRCASGLAGTGNT